MTPPLLRIIGPPGAGKSLLITALTEALRLRGRRIASSSTRVPITGAEGATVFALPNGGRVTASRVLAAREQLEVATSLDRNLDLLLAEALEEPGTPAILVVPTAAAPASPDPDRLATVTSEELATDFAAMASTEAHRLLDLIEQRLLGAPAPPPVPPPPQPRGPLGRLFRR